MNAIYGNCTDDMIHVKCKEEIKGYKTVPCCATCIIRNPEHFLCNSYSEFFCKNQQSTVTSITICEKFYNSEFEKNIKIAFFNGCDNKKCNGECNNCSKSIISEKKKIQECCATCKFLNTNDYSLLCTRRKYKHSLQSQTVLIYKKVSVSGICPDYKHAPELKKFKRVTKQSKQQSIIIPNENNDSKTL
jgi:hypothetical protein